VPPPAATGFQQWLATASSTAKSGSIAYLKPDMTTWGTLSLSGLAISSIAAANTGTTQLMRVDMAIGGAQLATP
jgi:hypothetical protein